MRIETDEIRDNLKYLALLARDYPSQAAAASEIISNQALLKLPKGTEHFMSDLHGENEAFVHILNSASGVIREKVDAVLGGTMPEAARAELATLIYYPTEKLPQLKARCTTEDALEQWYTQTLLQLIDICRLVSSKHTRDHVRSCLPSSCGYILDELLHAHFEDHDKDLYYGQIVGSIIENGRADRFIVRLCELIKHLAVDKLHIVGDLFDRGPRPDIILDLLMRHHNVDIQWGNHDVVWMGAAAGSPICICTVLKTTLSYHNHGMVEDCYGINLRHLQRMAEQFYGDDDLTIWMPHTDTARGPYTPGMLHRCAVMHKAITILMLKLECQVIDRNPDFQMQGRDYLRRIDWDAHTVQVGEKSYPLRDTSFPTVDPADPTKLNPDEQLVLQKLVQSFRQSEKLQQHIEFLYAKGSVYHIENGNLLYHGAVPMTEDGAFAAIRFEGIARSGKQLFDYCDRRARQGYSAPAGSPARLAGQDFLWYLWCGAKSPLFGRSAMTTFERLYIADPAAQVTAQPCPLFVPLVEAGYVDHSALDKQQVTRLVIAQYLAEVREAGVDTLILGCTHYPLIKEMIGWYMGRNVTLVDPAQTAAHHLERTLSEHGLKGNHEKGEAHFYVSDVPDSFAQTADLFLGEYKGGLIDQIAIDKY